MRKEEEMMKGREEINRVGGEWVGIRQVCGKYIGTTTRYESEGE